MPQQTPGGHGLGWHPSLPDIRDFPIRLAPVGPLPARVDLRDKMPPVGDQGQLGSCTAWAATAAWRYELMRQGRPDMEPSELATYYWTRQLEGTTKSDAGAAIRDAVKTLAKVGAAPENLWPYDIGKFAKAPPSSVKKAAGLHQALRYETVPQTLDCIRSALASGYPIIFGISVYESFESAAVARSGVVPMPSNTEPLLGGHAIAGAGYDDPAQHIIVRNSWSASWGDHGYFYLPYDYILNRQLASDLWIIKTVEA
jgi:C1A family cysteine protease